MKDQVTVEDVTYEAFEQTYPQLLLTLKQLIQAGESKRRIVAAVRKRALIEVRRAQIEFIVDYLLQHKTVL